MLIKASIRGAAALLTILTLGCAAHAEELSIERAVEMAIKHNPTAAAGRLSAQAAAHTARGARALANPELIVAPSVIGDAGADSAVLFSQPLEINGSRRVRGKAAAYQADAVIHNAEAIEREILLRVKQTYWDAARNQELVRLSEENLAYVEALDKAVRRQVDVGAVPGSQAVKSEVELSRARQELAQARLASAQAKAELNALMGRPVNSEFTVTTRPTFTNLTPDLSKLEAEALNRRPEVASSASEVRAAAEQVRAVKLQRVPDLALQARKESFEDGGSGVAMAVTLPVLDWGSARSDRRRAESAARSQQKRLEAVRVQVALDVRRAALAVEAAREIIAEYQGGILDKSEELARIAQKGYEKGATSYLEVLEAQRTLRAARTAYLSALADHARAVAQLEWATGVPASEFGRAEVKK